MIEKYVCLGCDHKFEVSVPNTCPKCQQNREKDREDHLINITPRRMDEGTVLLVLAIGAILGMILSYAFCSPGRFPS